MQLNPSIDRTLWTHTILNCLAEDHEQVVLIMAFPHVLQNEYRTYDTAVVRGEIWQRWIEQNIIIVDIKEQKIK